MLGTVSLPYFLQLNKHYFRKQHVSPQAENKLSEETFKTSNFFFNFVSSHICVNHLKEQVKITVVSKANANNNKKKRSRCFL